MENTTFNLICKEVILNLKYQHLKDNKTLEKNKLDMEFFLLQILYLYNKKEEDFLLVEYVKEVLENTETCEFIFSKKKNENDINSFLEWFNKIVEKELIFPTEFLFFLKHVNNFFKKYPTYNTNNEITIPFLLLFTTLIVKEKYEKLKNFIEVPKEVNEFIIKNIYSENFEEMEDEEANLILELFNFKMLKTAAVENEKRKRKINFEPIDEKKKKIELAKKNFNLYYRKKEIEKILINLVKKDNKNLVLFGKKNIGKKSLINNLYTYAKDEHIFLKEMIFYEIEALNISNENNNLVINPALNTIKNNIKNKKEFKEIIIILDFKHFIRKLISERNIYNGYFLEKFIEETNRILSETKKFLNSTKVNFDIRYIFIIDAEIDIASKVNFLKVTPIEIKMTDNKEEIIKIIRKKVREFELYYNRTITDDDLKLLLGDNKFNNFNEIYTHIDIMLAKSDFYTNGKHFILNNNNDKISNISLNELKEYLENNVFGQNEAISNIVDKFEIVKAGLNEQNKPLASFMLNGNSGTGKTEMARQLAKFLNVKLVRYDMSEYYDKFMISKLLGSPSGYVGYEEGSILVRDLKDNPDAVVLFDEIEKADPAVIKIFLQILEEGTITAANGEQLFFNNNIILFTTNAGAKTHIEKESGFIKTKIKQRSNEKLKNEFPIEFLNRIDGIIYFNELSKDNLIKIIYKELYKVTSMFNNNIEINITEQAIEELIKLGFNIEYGAREMKRVLDKYIKLLIARKINNSNIDINNAKVLNINFDSNDFKISFDNSKKELKK